MLSIITYNLCGNPLYFPDMMAKKTAVYVCQDCGAESAKWGGRCAACGEWNSLVERIDSTRAEKSAAKSGQPLKLQSLKSIKPGTQHKRLVTKISEVDIVLGGGLVPGSVVLMAGEPGIGKSTIVLQIAQAVAGKGHVLYASGEESLEQLHGRARRLGANKDALHVAATTNIDNIVATMHETDLQLVLVDSIQTMATSQVGSNPGTPSQITNSAQILIQAAKTTNTALIIIGHVTKEGAIAGPKILEHLVDVVLNLEGDRYGGFKLLRSVKNRFGPTNEVGVFEMEESGLKPVKNPSAALLAERHISDGSVVLATMEGSRPLLVEVQALVNKTSFGYPKRTASGLDPNRLNLLIAMLGKRTKLNLADSDVYVNIVGGMRVSEPAADLAVCMAIATASKGMKLKDDAVVFGEVGLSGEVRHVHAAQARIAEAKKLGFKAAIGPKLEKSGAFLRPVATVRDALNTYLVK